MLLLILTTLIWGTSFPLLKHTVEQLNPSVLIAVRFTIAALLFSPWLRQLTPKLLRDGGLLGLLYFGECALTLIGMQTVPANRAAFVISLNVVLVPLLTLLLGQQLPMQPFIAAGLALSGVGVMAWGGGGFSTGDVWIFGSAIGCAIYILLLGSVTQRHPTRPLAAVQLLTMASLGIVWAMPQLIQQSHAIVQHSSTLLYLALVVTATPIWAQAAAQRWVSAHDAALIYTLEPVFAAVFSVWILGESFSDRSWIGAGMILTAMILSQFGTEKAVRAFFAKIGGRDRI